MSWIEELIQLGAYAGIRMGQLSSLDTRVELWKCIKLAWNRKNEREQADQDRKNGTIRFVNDPED